MDIFFVVLREPPSGMGTQDEVPSRRVRRLHPHRIRLTANRIRPFLDRFSTITVESSTSKVQITSAKTLNNKGGLARQVRCFASRSYLHASRHQQIRSKTAGFRISARPSLPRRGENTAIHAAGRRSVRMRSPAWSGRIGSWLEHAMSLRRAGTFSPVHAVFSAETRRKPLWKASGRRLEGVFEHYTQVCLRIGENAIRGNPSNTTVQNALNPTAKRAGSLSSCDWA